MGGVAYEDSMTGRVAARPMVDSPARDAGTEPRPHNRVFDPSRFGRSASGRDHDPYVAGPRPRLFHPPAIRSRGHHTDVAGAVRHAVGDALLRAALLPPRGPRRVPVVYPRPITARRPACPLDPRAVAGPARIDGGRLCVV